MYVQNSETELGVPASAVDHTLRRLKSDLEVTALPALKALFLADTLRVKQAIKKVVYMRAPQGQKPLLDPVAFDLVLAMGHFSGRSGSGGGGNDMLRLTCSEFAQEKGRAQLHRSDLTEAQRAFALKQLRAEITPQILRGYKLHSSFDMTTC